ncbi:MAG: glycolate oxidase subunit GlcE [Gammaproteobacteria bacterium]|nr:glycolate oxidase subunit GlcE [Gammaproteobacteria bacterium]
MDRDHSNDLIARVQDAMQRRAPLQIIGGDSKAFYGRPAQGEPLHVGAHRGILNYEPTELVITARAGTPLADIERLLAEHGQMLPCEPPRFGATATLGGMVATNLSGPRRPYAGAVRDGVLGVTLINGAGERLRFGGEVMKNVAGYDVSRLQCGALGTLGVLLDVSLKVLPTPATELTLQRECTAEGALVTMNEWAGRAYPLSAAAFDGDQLYIRFSGSASAVNAARKKFGGDEASEGNEFWSKLREHRHGFFSGDAPLWRVSVAPASPVLALAGKNFLDWGGAQRWYRGDMTADDVRRVARTAGGHAQLFRGGDRTCAFTPLGEGLIALHRRVKQAMDPHGIFNPGRLYAEL